MEIRADEITRILREQLGGFTADIDVAEVGTVLSVGDGIARIHGLERCMAGELLELPHGVMGLALNLEEDSVGAVLFGESQKIREGDQVKRTKRIMSVPVGEALVGRVVERARPAHRRQGPDQDDRIQPRRAHRPRRRRPPARQGAAADRAQGDRRDDPDRPRPARAHHRRPPDRQDRGRGRHHHQPEGPGRRLHLRRHRPEAVHRRAGGPHPRGVRGHGLHDRGRRHRLRRGAPPVHRPLLRLRDGRVLPRQRQARGLHLRRPLEARRLLPRDLAAPAPAAGPRGVPRRRLLPPQPAPRARGQAERQEGRGLADRAADHRDPGRRRLRLHPDERHLDHGRPDLPRDRPLQLGHPPRDQRRHLGLPRRRLRAGEGDEDGGGPAAPRPRPVPRDGRPSRSSPPTSTSPPRRCSPAASGRPRS